MPLTLKGKSKARLDIQWDGEIPVELWIISNKNKDIPLYRQQIVNTMRISLELEQLDFSRLANITEIELVAVVKGKDKNNLAISESLPIQKCPHVGCGLWGHAREDGYCKYCGRRIRDHVYSYGFPKLEGTSIPLKLWDNTEGILIKKREVREHQNGVYSIGQYQDSAHPLANVEILEEKYDSKQEKRFLQFYSLLQQAELLGKFWNPPLVSFQKEYQRTIWIYYPMPSKEAKVTFMSALAYIHQKDVLPLTTQEIVVIGLQLCDIAKKIHSLGSMWGGLKLNDLILCRQKESISIYLRSRDIAWNANPNQNLIDSCLVPWEIFCDSTPLGEVTEVYIIAIILYLLKAKAPNLLSYNPITYHNGLPSLKLFKHEFLPQNPQNNFVEAYFESVINQALFLEHQERGFQTLQELYLALYNILHEKSPNILRPYHIDIGFALDIGNEKETDDSAKNQDALFASVIQIRKKQWGIFVLCDGISTATVGSGDIASRIVVQTFKKWWNNASQEERLQVCQYAETDLDQAALFLQQMIQESNAKIGAEAKKLRTSNIEDALIMGSTVTAGLLYNGILFFAWLGDSPIYKISPLGWERLNFEDNERNIRIGKGLSLDECFIEGGNALTRCVGANFTEDSELEIHFGYTRLYAQDQIVICSDGIPDFIEQDSFHSRYENYQMMRIASILREYENDALLNSKAVSSILISCVNQIGGGHDNLSAILIRNIPNPPISSESIYQKLKNLSPGMKRISQKNN
jgi:serine/threonine protein phosphatase PrpC